MRRNLLFLLAAIAAVALIPLAVAEEPNPVDGRLPFWWPALHPAPTFPATGLWKSEFDTELDGKLQEAHDYQLVLDSANGQLAGREEVPAEDPQSRSVYTGQLIPGSPPIVTLRRDDRQGRTVVYTGRLVAAGRIAGSYVDNRGTTGDWSLTFVTESMLEPSAKSAPDEVLFESVLGVYGKAIRGARLPYVNLRPPQRNLWTEEIKEVLEKSISYGEVDYIGTAKMVIPDSGVYTVEIPGAGVEFRVNRHRLEAGDVELKKGLYEIEIYTNHWGQPYLTYAQVAVYKKGTRSQIPFVNTASDIQAFRTQKIDDRPIVEVCDYEAKRVDPTQK